jgi:hypothetical protein
MCNTGTTKCDHPAWRGSNVNFLERRITTQTIGPDCLLAAIAGENRLDLVFRSKLDAVPRVTGAGFVADAARTVGGGARVGGSWAAGTDPVDLLFDGAVRRFDKTPAELALFAGLNAAIVLCNGERPQIVADWLRYHSAHHGLQGAILLDRSGPKPDGSLARRLERALSRQPADGLETVVVLTSDVPLGRPGFGPEAHPFNAPDAPGKDRMTPPEEDPWAAPFGEAIVFELLRCWFLDQARAVVNIEAYDLLRPASPKTVFDLAIESDVGMIPMIGERIFPWGRRRKQQNRYCLCAGGQVRG